MRHGHVLRGPVEGASLRSVDLGDVTADGVLVVGEGEFVGVVAATEAGARRALARAKPEWDLPDEPGEADLDSHLRAHPLEDEGWEGGFHREEGDVDSALAAAQIRLDATYRTAFIAHVPMETRVAVAEWTDDGRLTVWTGTQVPFGVREEVAAALAIPEASVRVVVPDFGGGFGGKHAGEVAVEAARLARAAGAPVKVRWSREDEFRHGYLRPAAVIDIRAGADRDGRLAAWQMTNLNSGTFGLEGPYGVRSQRLDYQAAESPLRQGSYRGLAATANHFARESAMDEVAVALEIDPLELRLTHLDDERLAAAFREVAQRIEWTRERPRGSGVGIAGGIEKDARVATAVELRVGDDRRPVLTRIVIAFDCGRIVNPDALRNQVEGAISMGLGGALFEAVHFERGGVLTNASMTDYRVPRITDLPAVEVVLLDRPDVPSAGAGETPIVALAPAIANAIFAATGVRLRDLPLVPDGRVPG
jgi:isoquinoline 1-oxidoreductase